MTNTSGTILLLLLFFLLAGFVGGVAFQHYFPNIIAPTKPLHDIKTVEGLSIYNDNLRWFNMNLFLGRNYDIVRVPSGKSMNPTLSKGDYIIAVFTFSDEELLKVGNIISFNSEYLKSGSAIHRIIKIDGEKIYTQGDNNQEPDPEYITKDDVDAIIVGVLYD